MINDDTVGDIFFSLFFIVFGITFAGYLMIRSFTNIDSKKSVTTAKNHASKGRKSKKS